MDVGMLVHSSHVHMSMTYLLFHCINFLLFCQTNLTVNEFPFAEQPNRRSLMRGRLGQQFFFLNF